MVGKRSSGLSVAQPDDLFPAIACGRDAAGQAWMPPVVSLLFVLGLAILGFGAIRDGSVIDAIYTVAGYTYGPLLGLFFFGILTRRRVCDGWVPFICILSPVLCYILSAHSAEWLGGYRIGFELLLINAGLTWLGLWLSGVGLLRN